MAFATAAVVTAGATAAAAYLDGKFQIRDEVSQLREQTRIEREYAKRVQENRISTWPIFAAACAARPNARAIWTRSRSWTFAELHDQAARYAQWLLLDQGIRPGDVVAFYLINSAEFLMLLYACHCIGVAPALLNYNLEGAALRHCLDVVEAKLLIVDGDEACRARVAGSLGEEQKETKVVTLDEALMRMVEKREVRVPGDEYRKDIKGESPWCILFTSGTTGMPKGCPFTTRRTHLLGVHIAPSYNMKPDVDCWYNAMPLYHGTAIASVGINLLGGIGCALAPRFSVSNFWPDVHASGATVFIYVGETARYLLNAPPHPLERQHRLRLAYGNGLRPDVWTRLQDRFGIPEVAEFFSSSEGVFTLFSWMRGPYLAGCVGHHGLVMRRKMHNVYVPVRIDHQTGDLYRDPATGFAQRVPYDEGGEMLVAVPSRSAFAGYWRNPAATEKRFAVDVFKKGDLYYRSGDALRRTADGHWYFLDRLGDTFRWKSENVSTAEVAEVLGRYPGIQEANVYGVVVPGHEGRAGCAALDLAPGVNIDYSGLLAHLRAHLPKYAIPVFLRVVQASSHIHNHKQNKVLLRQEGVDPALLGTLEPACEGRPDLILWLAPGKDAYVPFERADWDALTGLKARL